MVPGVQGTARIDWTLAGRVAGAFDVALPMTSTFELNLLTGRAFKHTDGWDLSKVSPPAAAACVASRLAWSARQASQDASDAVGKAAESLSSLASLDDDDDTIYSNPADPTRFFQGSGDNFKSDALLFATGVAIMYAVFKAFSLIETL
jgi:hypothetical protein